MAQGVSVCHRKSLHDDSLSQSTPNQQRRTPPIFLPVVVLQATQRVGHERELSFPVKSCRDFGVHNLSIPSCPRHGRETTFVRSHRSLFRASPSQTTSERTSRTVVFVCTTFSGTETSTTRQALALTLLASACPSSTDRSTRFPPLASSQSIAQQKAKEKWFQSPFSSISTSWADLMGTN